MKKLISIICPVYNEEKNISFFYKNLSSELKKLKNEFNFEIIFTDNNSSDRTLSNLKKLKSIDKRIKIIKLTKNHGYQKSLWTGYNFSKGDACITIDCDLQDPVNLISKFLKIWKTKKVKVVYGIRKNRDENFLLVLFRKIFYKFFNLFHESRIEENVGDFLLTDKIIVKYIKSLNEHELYLRAFILNLGFPSKGINYNRKKRIYGKSKFSMYSYFKFGISSIFSETSSLLKMSGFLSIIFLLISLALSGTYFVGKYFDLFYMAPGFATTTVLILLTMAINCLFFGILGAYIHRINLKTKNVPITIIEKII